MKRLFLGLGVLGVAAPLWAQTAKPAQATRPAAATAPRSRSVKALLDLARRQAEQKNAAGALATLRAARALAPNSEDVLSAYAEALSASPTPDAAIPVLDALAPVGVADITMPASPHRVWQAINGAKAA